jgi:hypothetical protein
LLKPPPDEKLFAGSKAAISGLTFFVAPTVVTYGYITVSYKISTQDNVLNQIRRWGQNETGELTHPAGNDGRKVVVFLPSFVKQLSLLPTP